MATITLTINGVEADRNHRGFTNMDIGMFESGATFETKVGTAMNSGNVDQTLRVVFKVEDCVITEPRWVLSDGTEMDGDTVIMNPEEEAQLFVTVTAATLPGGAPDELASFTIEEVWNEVIEEL